jgi:hypothetical protein
MSSRELTLLFLVGITLLVIMYSHWMLALDAIIVPGLVFLVAAVFFIGFWLRVYFYLFANLYLFYRCNFQCSATFLTYLSCSAASSETSDHCGLELLVYVRLGFRFQSVVHGDVTVGDLADNVFFFLCWPI